MQLASHWFMCAYISTRAYYGLQWFSVCQVFHGFSSVCQVQLNDFLKQCYMKYTFQFPLHQTVSNVFPSKNLRGIGTKHKPSFLTIPLKVKLTLKLLLATFRTGLSGMTPILFHSVIVYCNSLSYHHVPWMQMTSLGVLCLPFRLNLFYIQGSWIRQLHDAV